MAGLLSGLQFSSQNSQSMRKPVLDRCIHEECFWECYIFLCRVYASNSVRYNSKSWQKDYGISVSIWNANVKFHYVIENIRFYYPIQRNISIGRKPKKKRRKRWKQGTRRKKKGVWKWRMKKNQWPRDDCKGFEPKRHKCIAMKYSTTAHSRWVVIAGLYVSQQSINIADSPKAAFVHITLADPLSRYLRGMCVGYYSLVERPRRHVGYQKSEKMRAKRS